MFNVTLSLCLPRKHRQSIEEFLLGLYEVLILNPQSPICGSYSWASQLRSSQTTVVRYSTQQWILRPSLLSRLIANFPSIKLEVSCSRVRWARFGHLHEPLDRLLIRTVSAQRSNFPLKSYPPALTSCLFYQGWFGRSGTRTVRGRRHGEWPAGNTQHIYGPSRRDVRLQNHSPTGHGNLWLTSIMQVTFQVPGGKQNLQDDYIAILSTISLLPVQCSLPGFRSTSVARDFYSWTGADGYHGKRNTFPNFRGANSDEWEWLITNLNVFSWLLPAHD